MTRRCRLAEVVDALPPGPCAAWFRRRYGHLEASAFTSPTSAGRDTVALDLAIEAREDGFTTLTYAEIRVTIAELAIELSIPNGDTP